MNKISYKSIIEIQRIKTIRKLNLSNNKIGLKGCKLLNNMK